MKLKERPTRKIVRVPPEDPEIVRTRDDAYLEKYVGETWAKRKGVSER